MNPGRSVASPRSITWAPAGTGPLPTETILPSVTTMDAPSRRLVPVESNTWAALSTTLVTAADSAACAVPVIPLTQITAVVAAAAANPLSLAISFLDAQVVCATANRASAANPVLYGESGNASSNLSARS